MTWRSLVRVQLPLKYIKMEALFHIITLVIMTISAFFVVKARNPVDSVLFLVLVFLNAAAYLLLIEAEFLALIFLVIYVGAIAVLFLFIVMMLDIKIQKSQGAIMQYVPFALIFGLLFFLEIFLSLTNTFSNTSIKTANSSWISVIDPLSNIEVLGQVLYNDFIVSFLMGGFLLLIAMIGAIVLTLNFVSHRRNENISRQISRSGIKLYSA
jgi:NADH-quinone oxidoreductase subunit J